MIPTLISEAFYKQPDWRAKTRSHGRNSGEREMAIRFDDQVVVVTGAFMWA